MLRNKESVCSYTVYNLLFHKKEPQISFLTRLQSKKEILICSEGIFFYVFLQIAPQAIKNAYLAPPRRLQRREKWSLNQHASFYRF
jgi:hypothetical protein